MTKTATATVTKAKTATPPKGVVPITAKPITPFKSSTGIPAKTTPALPPAPKLKTAYVAAPEHPIPEAVDPLLVTILSWPRKHNSASEQGFKVWLNAELAKHGTVRNHAEGALSVTILPADGKASTTLFSCHIDTIDPLVPTAADPLAKKRLTYDPNFGLIGLDTNSVGDSLGADDGIGVWIMLSMVAAKVPGTYVFHRGEECGGVSAKAIAAREKDWLKQFDACVAFDRPRTNEVITHQGGRECASQKFALALCTHLNASGFDYKPSAAGVYTDNKEYRGVIAECVNLGVGYEGQHGRQETQDYAHAHALMLACLALAWDALPIDRDPAKPDPVPVYKGTNAKPMWKDSLWDDAYNDGWRDDAKDKKPAAKASIKLPTAEESRAALIDDARCMSLDDLRWTCTEEPDATLELVVALLRENSRLKADVATLEGMVGI